MSEAAISEAIDQAIEATAPLVSTIAADEQEHLAELVQNEQAANVVLKASQAFQAAQMAAAGRAAFMAFLSKRYKLGQRDTIRVDGTITRSIVVQTEASE